MSLNDKAAKLLHDAREILAAATKEERGLTQEEAAKHAAIMDDFDAIQATIRAAKRVESADVPAVSVESREVRREAAVAQPKALVTFLLTVRKKYSRPGLPRNPGVRS